MFFEIENTVIKIIKSNDSFEGKLSWNYIRHKSSSHGDSYSIVLYSEHKSERELKGEYGDSVFFFYFSHCVVIGVCISWSYSLFVSSLDTFVLMLFPFVKTLCFWAMNCECRFPMPLFIVFIAFTHCVFILHSFVILSNKLVMLTLYCCWY